MKKISLPAYNAALGGKRLPPKDFVRQQVQEENQRAWEEILIDQAKCFDVVVLRYHRPYDHIAIVTEDPKLLLITDRTMNSHLCAWNKSPAFWGPERIEGVFRYVGT